jgi:hypothetical protein
MVIRLTIDTDKASYSECDLLRVFCDKQKADDFVITLNNPPFDIDDDDDDDDRYHMYKILIYDTMLHL